jgi:hypothetical protein
VATDGKPYTLGLTIELAQIALVEPQPGPRPYHLTWKTSAGELAAIGIGVFDAPIVSVIFSTQTSVGVGSYRLEQGTITGTWTAPELQGVTFRETCTRGRVEQA